MSNCDWWKIKWNIKSGAEYLYSEVAVHIVQRAIFIFFSKKKKKRERSELGTGLQVTNYEIRMITVFF